MDTFPCSPRPRCTEVYDCAVHVGQRHLAQSSSPSGQPSSILVFREWQIGCHKLRLIAACCSQRKSFHSRRGLETKPCTYKHCVWHTELWHIIRWCVTRVCTSITQIQNNTAENLNFSILLMVFIYNYLSICLFNNVEILKSSLIHCSETMS